MHPSMMIDEISTSKLLEELQLRRVLAKDGKCTYCKKPIREGSPYCKEFDRHMGKDHKQLEMRKATVFD